MILADGKELVKHFPVRGGLFSDQRNVVHAVDGVNLQINEGETLGLVGESGCGKTTLGRIFLGLIEPTKGTVIFEGHDLSKLDKAGLKKVRRETQIIFQDPFASLNPRRTIGQIVGRPFIAHGMANNALEEKVVGMLDAVGLTPSHMFINRYPHELSGGQRQRVGIARALALRPKFVVADEPVSALDLSVRAQILTLMRGLGEKYNCSYLFITHDLSVVRSFCARVAIMYLGRIIELSNVEELFSKPAHPYTRGLLEATPIPNPRVTRSITRRPLHGEPPNPIHLPTGCRFHTRCRIASRECTNTEPELCSLTCTHQVACLNLGQ